MLLVPTGGPAATLELNEAIALWEKLQPGMVIPMHFRNQKCDFPKYGVEDLMKLKPMAIQTGKSEIEVSVGQHPLGQILILDSAL